MSRSNDISINILLGAGIGTTITSQIVAFNISKYMLFVVAIGFFMLSFGRSKNVQQVGNGIFALGLTFHGISTMSSAMVPLRAYQPFIDLLVGLSNPIIGIAVSAVFTALIQSSTAAVGVVQALASQQLISVRTAVIFVFGGKLLKKCSFSSKYWNDLYFSISSYWKHSRSNSCCYF